MKRLKHESNFVTLPYEIYCEIIEFCEDNVLLKLRLVNKILFHVFNTSNQCLHLFITIKSFRSMNTKEKIKKSIKYLKLLYYNKCFSDYFKIPIKKVVSTYDVSEFENNEVKKLLNLTRIIYLDRKIENSEDFNIEIRLKLKNNIYINISTKIELGENEHSFIYFYEKDCNEKLYILKYEEDDPCTKEISIDDFKNNIKKDNIYILKKKLNISEKLDCLVIFAFFCTFIKWIQEKDDDFIF